MTAIAKKNTNNLTNAKLKTTLIPKFIVNDFIYKKLTTQIRNICTCTSNTTIITGWDILITGFKSALMSQCNIANPTRFCEGYDSLGSL